MKHDACIRKVIPYNIISSQAQQSQISFAQYSIVPYVRSVAHVRLEDTANCTGHVLPVTSTRILTSQPAAEPLTIYTVNGDSGPWFRGSISEKLLRCVKYKPRGLVLSGQLIPSGRAK
ncbi:hypothetical protein KQX54_004124 [Cotesia glomerata]|uniref:Uncharacterized protein n=1 Tax=Cotesia glomerata TaxID=32391 RepID=A0AAV7J1W7_COTGL|nr:hypothetical protein KQX54_004124 [Cotesia glomerata]